MIIEHKNYGSEACHAYSRDGKPQHSVPYKDKKRAGELRPTTLRDIKEHGWLPSVSSILGIMEKKGLDGWKKEQVAKAASDLHYSTEYSPIDREGFIQDILSLADSRMTKARDLGTEIHGAIENYLRVWSFTEALREPAGDYSEHVGAAVAALKELRVWGQLFESERTFASHLGYGGTVDIAGSTEEWIFDFKAISTLKKRYDWPDRAAQIAAYQMGKYGKLCQGGNILISTENPGEYAIRIWDEEELRHGWDMFCCCFSLWKCVSKYNPAA